jgi:hypothetical protein
MKSREGLSEEWTDGTFVPEESGQELPPIEDAATLIASEIVLPPDIIEGVAHRGGKIVLGGASKAFKTHTLVDMAVSVASGREWIGFQSKRGRVLFINFEIPSAFFIKRIAVICEAKGVTLEARYLDVWNLRGYATSSEMLLPLLLKRIARGHYLLIIIDPSYKLLGGRSDENRTGDIAALLNDFERLAVKTEAAVAFGAHYSKGNQSGKESIDRIGGSGVWARDPDSILNFTKHEEEDCFTIDATLRNHPPVPPFVVRWNYPLMEREQSLDPERLKKPAGRKREYNNDQLLDLIDLEPLTSNEWQQKAKTKLKMSESTFFRRLKEIEADGTASIDDQGRWHCNTHNPQK